MGTGLPDNRLAGTLALPILSQLQGDKRGVTTPAEHNSISRPARVGLNALVGRPWSLAVIRLRRGSVSMDTVPKPVLATYRPLAARLRHSWSNLAKAPSRRTRASAGVAGPLVGFIALWDLKDFLIACLRRDFGGGSFYDGHITGVRVEHLIRRRNLRG